MSFESQHIQSQCVICQDIFDVVSEKGGFVKASSKAVATLLRCSRLRCDSRLETVLTDSHEDVFYHSNCYKAYANEKLLERQKRRSDSTEHIAAPPKVLRSAVCCFQ